MSDPIVRVAGTAAPLLIDSIDTDQIMPKQFLKRIERAGFGPFVFHEWRHGGDFVLDTPEHRDATVLLAGANFGSGSSREQAVWGLLDAGIRAVLATSFAPIFVQNSLRSRLLLIPVATAPLEQLATTVRERPTTQLEIDLEAGVISYEDQQITFRFSQEETEVFVHGTDYIEQTLTFEAHIRAHEARRERWMPATGFLRTSESK